MHGVGAVCDCVYRVSTVLGRRHDDHAPIPGSLCLDSPVTDQTSKGSARWGICRLAAAILASHPVRHFSCGPSLSRREASFITLAAPVTVLMNHPVCVTECVTDRGCQKWRFLDSTRSFFFYFWDQWSLSGNGAFRLKPPGHSGHWVVSNSFGCALLIPIRFSHFWAETRFFDAHAHAGNHLGMSKIWKFVAWGLTFQRFMKVLLLPKNAAADDWLTKDALCIWEPLFIVSHLRKELMERANQITRSRKTQTYFLSPPLQRMPQDCSLGPPLLHSRQAHGEEGGGSLQKAKLEKLLFGAKISLEEEERKKPNALERLLLLLLLWLLLLWLRGRRHVFYSSFSLPSRGKLNHVAAPCIHPLLSFFFS